MIFVDVETTGLDPQHDRITQVAIVSDAGEVWQTLVNPGRPIPPEVQALTRITDATVADAPPFAEVAAEVARRLSGQVLVGFGCWLLDVPILGEEFERAGVEFAFGEVIDLGALYKLARPRNLAAAVADYLGAEPAAVFAANAHGALADAVATRDVFHALVVREDLARGRSPEELALLSCHGKRPADPFGKLVLIDGHVCFNTHRNRGVRVCDDVGYAEWMLTKADFPRATKRVLLAELAKLEAEQEEDEGVGLFDLAGEEQPL